MQEGVSIIKPSWCGSSYNCRLMHRGGGSEAGDTMQNSAGASTCTQLCTYGMGFGAHWAGAPTAGWDPYYLKCYLASQGAQPPNGRRLQFPSQFNTVNLDPSLPQMNVTDWRSCMRKNKLEYTFLLILLILNSLTS